MKLILLVGSGSFAGGIARYLIQLVFNNWNIAGYAATFTANVTGCFLIGLVMGDATRNGLSPEWQLFIATGVLGGFTTFSAFSFETVELLRSGNLMTALLYMMATLATGLIAAYAGILLRNM